MTIKPYYRIHPSMFNSITSERAVFGITIRSFTPFDTGQADTKLVEIRADLYSASGLDPLANTERCHPVVSLKSRISGA